ncbi:MAG: 3-deoxy-D-manno-octulosonate 8-phosphate phosphatase [Epsilonproteobacteria bacterium]|nr:MAG: 3-deoxy-D-manno-octulosonate 8-phosphate phosphatase [Campylobacterota bacterium]
MIKLIVLDVDGTMTNGQIIYDETGNETKSFNVKDGLAIAVWTKILNKKCAIITGRISKIVQKRAKELNITYTHQGVKDKLKLLQEICATENIKLDEVAAIGDDLNDLSMLKAVGISYAPKDAAKQIKKIATKTTKKSGGDGAVREMIEHILKQENSFHKFIDIW